MNEPDRRYEEIDLPFYRDEVAPFLPPTVLDFHAHVWRADQWLRDESRPAPLADNSAALGTFAHARYMSTSLEYSAEALRADGRRLFPDRDYAAVVFGQPTPAVDVERTNAYVAASAGDGFYPLRVTRRDEQPATALADEVRARGWRGFKVFLPWVGDGYGSVTVADMIGPAEMRVADDLALTVLLHVPGRGRLADPRVQADVRRLAGEYPRARLVLAHCGRCYLPDEMRAAVGAVRDLDNVYLDTAMVMDPTVFEILFANLDSRRVLFATDLPVAAMRGRRVYVMDHWVDVVLPGYPPSAYRLAGDVRATFMAWEIAAALRRGATLAGLDDARLRALFHDNGAAVLGRRREESEILRGRE